MWEAPKDNGSCPINSYELYLDDGNSGAFVKTDDGLIGGKAYLRAHTVNFAATQSGQTFRYKLKSLNEIGEAESIINSQLLA
jgi:hypothetical protein